MSFSFQSETDFVAGKIHLPFPALGFLEFLKKLLLKLAFILEMSVSLTFSKDEEYSFYFLKLALFKL